MARFLPHGCQASTSGQCITYQCALRVAVTRSGVNKLLLDYMDHPSRLT